MPNLAYAYFRSVILQILIEELSLFPLWLFKAAVTTSDDLLGLWIKGDVITLLKFWYEFCTHGRTNGGLYEELYPYLFARVLSHGDYAVHLSRQFAQCYALQFERPFTTSLKQRKQFSANTLIMSRSIMVNGSSGSIISCEGDHLQEMPLRNAACGESSQAVASTNTLLLPLILSPQEMLSRCFRLLLAQPFYASSLLVLQAHILARRVGCLLKMDSGENLSQNTTLSLRSIFALCLVPLEFSYLGLGIVETLINRITVKQSPFDKASMQHRSTTRLLPKALLPLVGVLSTGIRGLLIEARELFASYGVVGLGAYGAISCIQYIPGSFNFISARILLFLVTGPSAIRLRQLAIRREVVQQCCNRRFEI